MLNQKYFIAYASQITLASAFYRSTFKDIARESNTNNQLSGITGFLLFKDGKFFQYFEGDELACRNLLMVLKTDKRHTNLQIIAEGNIEHTIFNQWGMCCFDGDSDTDGFEDNDLLTQFQPAQWQSGELDQVIAILAKRHAQDIFVPNHSYANLRVKQLGNRHKIFLLLQLILLLVIAIVVGILLLRKSLLT